MTRKQLLLSVFLGVCGFSGYLYLLAPASPSALRRLTGFSDQYVVNNSRSRLATDLTSYLESLRGKAAHWKPLMGVAIRDKRRAAKKGEKKSSRLAKSKKRKGKPKRVAQR